LEALPLLNSPLRECERISERGWRPFGLPQSVVNEGLCLS